VRIMSLGPQRWACSVDGGRVLGAAQNVESKADHFARLVSISESSFTIRARLEYFD